MKGTNGLMNLDIELPRKDEDGNYYISYSQKNSFNSEKGFNTGLPGAQEYILSYFFGMQWPDAGWGDFGKDVEDYICEKKSADLFNDSEKSLLDTIKPLGIFQKEVKLWLAGNLYLLGYIDDCSEDMSWIRDYKTASKNSSSKYYEPDYEQLDLYAMYVKQETGKLPDKMEVCIIERKGNVFGYKENRRDLLSVGNEVWYVDRETSEERLEKIRTSLMKTIIRISDLYKVFKKVK